MSKTMGVVSPQRASRDAVELQKLGLLGIRERAELLGGQVRIDFGTPKKAPAWA